MGSGFKTFTAGAVLTASDVNNYLMEQGVMYFATTTARDTAITSPEDGMVAYIGSNDVNEGLYIYNGTAWRKGPGWNAPWGVLGSSVRTSSQASITTLADITSHTVTFTAIANRFYSVSASGVLNSTGSPAYCDVLIREGSTTLALTATQTANSGFGMGYSMRLLSTFSAGSHTVKLSVAQVGGGGSATFTASATIPALLLVEDVGPAGAPA